MARGSGDKTIIKNQEVIINVLDKIEKLASKSEKNVETIQLNISENIISGITSIKSELQTQTKILNGILKSLGGKAIKAKRDDSDITKSIISGDIGGDKIVDFGKILVILGGAFFAFGKGLGQLSEISKEQAITMSLVMLTMFGSIAMIYSKGYDISIAQSAILSLTLVMLAMTVQSISRIFSDMPDVSTKQMITGIAIAAIFVPITAYFIKSLSSMLTGKGIMGALGNVINAGIIAVSSMGALLIFPMIALSLVATANVLKLMPSIDLKKLAIAAVVAASLIPIVMIFKNVLRALRGDAFTVAIRTVSSIAGKVSGSLVQPMSMMQSLGASLLIIPVLAITVVATAWIFMALPNKFKAPPIDWVFKVGLSLLFFSMSFLRMSKHLEVLSKETGTGVFSITTREEIKKKKFAGGKAAGMFGMMMALSASVVATAWIFMLFPNEDKLKAPPYWWIIRVGLAMYLYATAIGSLISSFQGKKSAISIRSTFKPVKIKPAALVMAVAAIPLIALSIVGVAHILQKLPEESKYKAPPLGWIILTGLTLIIFSKAISIIISALSGKSAVKTGNKILDVPMKGRVTAKDIVLSAFALVLTALAVRAVAEIFQTFPEDNVLKAPPLWWTIKAGIAVLLFSYSLKAIAKSLTAGKNKMTLVGVVLAGLAMAALATGIVATAWIFKFLPPDNQMKSPPLVWTLRAGITMALFAFSVKLMSTAIKGKWKDIFKAGAMMGILAAAVVIIAWEFMLLPPGNKMKAPPIIWVISTGITMVLFALSIALLMKINQQLNIKKAGKAAGILALIAGAVVAIAWEFSLLPSKFKSIPIEWILPTALAMMVFGIAFWVIGKLGKKAVITGALAMMFAGAAIVLIGIGVKKFAEAISMIDKPWQMIAIMGAVILTLGVVMAIAGLGPLPGFITLGSAAMVVAGLALILVGVGVNKFAKSFSIVDKPWEFIGQIAALIGAVGLAMAGAGLISPAILIGSAVMIMAGGALVLIGKGIKSFADIMKTIDPNDLTYMIDIVLSKVSDSFGAIGKKFGGSGLVGAIMAITGTDDVSKGIRMVKGMGNVLTEIAMGVKDFANLTFIDSKGTSVALTPADMEKVSANIKMIVSSLSSTLGELGQDPNAKRKWFLGKSAIDKGKKVVSNITDGLFELADFVRTILDIPDVNRIKQTIEDVILAIPSAFVKAGSMLSKEMDAANVGLNFLSRIPENFVNAIVKLSKKDNKIDNIAKNFADMAVSMQKFSAAVDTLDDVKLDKMNQTFSTLAEIYKFSDDADIGEQIAEGIKTGIEMALELIERFIKKENPDKKLEIIPEVRKEIYAANDTTGRTDSGITSDTKVLADKMQAVINKLDTELTVRIVNENFEIG